jgi:serine/threonine-protein kinase
MYVSTLRRGHCHDHRKNHRKFARLWERRLMHQLIAGSTLGRYELLLPVAKGGMAQVWAARLRGSRGFQKLVAVKTILPGTIDNTRLEQMFLEEAQLAAQIHHPNVVETLELGEHEGALYLVMEWVDGEPISYLLSQALERGGLPLPIAVNLIGQLCRGLHAAHELCDDRGNLLGVVHRDVSPQNVLVTLSGAAKLVDFGIAKATGRASNMTQEGEIKGKFGYMAPEQVQGHKVDRRSDLFALGILAYLLTTGKHPFRGDNPAATVRNIMSDKAPAAPSAVSADYPAELEAVIMKAIEKSPDRRYATADELFVALEAALPEAAETSFTVQVAAYLKSLLGARSDERRAAIRRAQELADRQRAEHASSSVGTLRAISLDSIPDSTQGGSASSSVGASPSVEAPAPNPFATPPSRPRKVAWAAGGAAVAMLAIALYSSSRSDAPASAGTSAAAAPPAGSAIAPNVAPSVAVVPAVPAPVAPASSTVADDDATETQKSKKLKVPGRLAVKAIAPVAPPPTAAPAAPAAAVPKPAPSANAWDRDAFGGRH